MSGIQEGSSKTDFVANRPIAQMELSGSNKPSIMISSMRQTMPFSKGQPVVAKVMQTPSIGQQTPNILVVGQARMAQPSTNLLVSAGATACSVPGGFVVGGSMVGDKAGTILGSLQQSQQLQQAQQQLLQQHQQQPHQNLLNGLVTFSSTGVNLSPSNNQPGLFVSSASGVTMDVAQHSLMPGTVNLHNRIIRNRAPTILENRSTLPSIQTATPRPARPNVVPLNKPQQHQLQVSSSSPPSSMHMVAMGTLALCTPSLASGSNYVMTNPGQRVILSASRATLPQLQRPSVSSVSIRSPWPNQVLSQTPASSSASARAMISGTMVDMTQRSPSVTVQQLVRPVSLPGMVHQQQTPRAILSSPLTSPINLSISTTAASTPSPRNIVLGQSQALNLSQPRQPTVILASTSVTKTTAPSVVSQVNKIISQSPLNLTKSRKVKLQSGGSSAYSTLPLTPASTLKSGGIVPLPVPNIGSMPISSSSVVPVAKVIPQMHIVNSGSQQIQLHQIQAATGQIHVQQQPQQAHLVPGSAQNQLRTAVTSVQTASLVPLQPANAMLIGGGYITSGSAVLHADKPHLLQQFSIQDGSRFQGAHLLSQNHLSLSGLQTITIPASANVRPPNSGSVSIVTSSTLASSSSASNLQASSRMQPVVLSIDSSAQALQNFAIVAAPGMVPAVSSSECGGATDLSQKDSAVQQIHQHQQHNIHVPVSSAFQQQKLPIQHQFVSLSLPSSSLVAADGATSASYSNNNGGGTVKQQNQSPRPPSILRKRTHDSLTNASKKNLFAAPSTSMIPINSGASLTLTSSSSNLFSGTGQLSYFQQNLPMQLHSVQQQQQLFLHQPIGQTLTASEFVVKLSALGPNEGGLQFVVPTSPQAFDVAKDSSQSSTDTASSTENTPKPNQSLPSDMSRNCKVNVVASSNGGLRVAMETSVAKQSEEEEVKLHARKKPRKQQLIAQTPSSFPSDMWVFADNNQSTSPKPHHKDVVINDGISEDEEEDNIDDGMEDMPYVPGSIECFLDDASCAKDVEVEKEFQDKNGVRWTQEKQRSCALLTNQYQCSWKPRNNHFASYSDFKLKEEKKMSISELSNQRCILQRISGFKLYLISDHFNLLKEEEEESMNSMEELKMALSVELQNLNMMEEFQSTNELVMAYTQRSKKCIELLEEGKESLLKLLGGKAKANEIVTKHQSKRVVKKKDRS